jgi:hypothetical protein
VTWSLHRRVDDALRTLAAAWTSISFTSAHLKAPRRRVRCATCTRAIALRTSTSPPWLEPIDAGDLALVLDACYSAAAFANPRFRPGTLDSRGLARLAYDKGMWILAASQADGVAVAYLLEARQLAVDASFPLRHAEVLATIADIYKLRGQAAIAEDTCRRARSIATTLGPFEVHEPSPCLGR